MDLHLRQALLGLSTLALVACSLQHQDLSQPRVGQSENFYWTKPAVGQRWCLSVDPGLPALP